MLWSSLEVDGKIQTYAQLSSIQAVSSNAKIKKVPEIKKVWIEMTKCLQRLFGL